MTSPLCVLRAVWLSVRRMLRTGDLVAVVSGHSYVEEMTDTPAYVQVLRCNDCGHISVGWRRATLAGLNAQAALGGMLGDRPVTIGGIVGNAVRPEASAVVSFVNLDMTEAERCNGRYPVPGRSEPFEVTYRCGLPIGHAGPHRAEPALEPEASAPISDLDVSGRLEVAERLQTIAELADHEERRQLLSDAARREQQDVYKPADHTRCRDLIRRLTSASPPPAKPQHTNTYGCRCGCAYMPDAPAQPDARIEEIAEQVAERLEHDALDVWGDYHGGKAREIILTALREYAEALKAGDK